MGRGHGAARAAYGIALLAMALFCFASLQSIVMQAAAGGVDAMPMCGAMTSTHHLAPSSPSSHQKAHAPCEFCAAAGHAPVCTSDIAAPASSTVAWTTYRLDRSLGPRGPPQVTPRSRGPPHASLIV